MLLQFLCVKLEFINMQINNRIFNYGVELELLTIDKIEKVRFWRNDSKISQYMEYREEITPEQQESWFNKLNNGVDNLYWIIRYKEEDIGLINIKDLDYDKRTGETGVFIYSDKYLNTDISYRAHLVMFDYIFLELDLRSTYCHILKSNLRAQRFSQFLGANIASGQEEVDNQLYFIYKNDYLNNINRIRFINKYAKQQAKESVESR